jgi:hypothetical protein
LVPDPPPDDFDFSDPKQIKELLSYAANRVVRGELDPKCAYALSSLADSAIRADAAITAAERLERLQPKKSPPTGRLDFRKLDSQEFEIYKALTEKATVPFEQP